MSNRRCADLTNICHQNGKILNRMELKVVSEGENVKHDMNYIFEILSVDQQPGEKDFKRK